MATATCLCCIICTMATATSLYCIICTMATATSLYCIICTMATATCLCCIICKMPALFYFYAFQFMSSIMIKLSTFQLLIMYISLQNENKRKYTSPPTLLNASTFRSRSSKSAFIFMSSIIFLMFESSVFRFLSLTSIGFFLTTLAICSMTFSILAIASVEA